MDGTTDGDSFLKKERSSTFGEYEIAVRNENDIRLERQNLVMSPVRSLVSGVALRHVLTRRRSETWHGAVVETNQVANKTVTNPGSVPNLKNILQEIITKELWAHLDGFKLKCSEEFVGKSSTISKAIGERARVVVGESTKIVSCVFLGEIRGDGIEVASQCLLDVNQDAFACGNFKSATIFAVGTLFVVPS